MLDFRILTFLELCKVGSYTKTAESLHITQPAVTQHIKYLETYFGTRLFMHTGKQLVLTEAGHLLRQAATTIYADTKMLSEQLRALPRHQVRLRFAATKTVGEFVLPPMVSAYLARNPEVAVTMVIENTESILQRMERGEIDFAIVEGYFSRLKFDFRAFLKDRFIPVCGRNYPLPQTVSSLFALMNEPLFLREQGSGTREVFERVLHEKNLSLLDFPHISEISNLNVIKYLVAQNQGITFLYESAVRKEIEDGSLREFMIPDFSVRREYYFIVLKNSVFKETFQRLVFEEMRTDDFPL